MENPLIIYKKLGETPLEALERARKEYGIGESVPMTYAGRLDPMAEGTMIVLTGEACKIKDQYSVLDKTYEFEILSGFETDTYDLLGLVTNSSPVSQLDIEKVKKYLEENTGKMLQKYPPFSSKTVDGKQLHQHARDGSLPEVVREVELLDVEFLGERNILAEDSLQTVLERVRLVHGDFRQEEITSKWNEVLKEYDGQKFQITKWRVAVSSGFYIRQLVTDIGKHFGVPTVTFHITRTNIGSYTNDQQ